MMSVGLRPIWLRPSTSDLQGGAADQRDVAALLGCDTPVRGTTAVSPCEKGAAATPPGPR